jgi:drug/metabolite transporter (DMT)-like permease
MTRRGWVAFAAMSVIWGTPYLLIRIAVRHGVPPIGLAFSRVGIAAAVLLLIAGRAGVLGSLRGRLGWLLAFTLAEVVVPLPAIGYGERAITSSLAAILIASVPLIVALLALRVDPDERPTLVRGVGLCVGFLGVVALVGLDVAGSRHAVLGAAAVLLGAIGYAAGPMILKRRLGDLDPRAAMGASMALASVILAIPAALSAPAHLPAAGPIAAVVALGVVCTAVAFVGYAILIGEVGPARASVVTYVNPLVALLLGVALLGERPGAGTYVGLVLILSGSWLATRAT